MLTSIVNKNLNKNRQFWESYLKDIPESVELPFDKLIFSEEISCEAASAHIELPSEIYKGIKQIASEQKVTVYNILLSAFLILLNKLKLIFLRRIWVLQRPVISDLEIHQENLFCF